jgi:hypothetical protein
MELHGSIMNNLTSAVQSARRLSGHPVHADTLGHWADIFFAMLAESWRMAQLCLFNLSFWNSKKSWLTGPPDRGATCRYALGRTSGASAT